MRRKSRSAIQKIRIMNFYIVIDTIGQLHGHLTLTWKAKQETPLPILKERTRGEKTVLACSFLRIFMTF